MKVFVLLFGVLYQVLGIEIVQKVDEDIFDKTGWITHRCHGTEVGFGYSGTLDLHYQNLKNRYQDCTYVHGNLEITNLDDPQIEYDLSFLSKIRYVSGYILIGLVTEIARIPLTSLEVVRGNNTYRVRGEEYSLIVALTSRFPDVNVGLKELHMPSLKEVTMGKVLFSQNPALCYVDTIDWDTITHGRNNSINFGELASSETCDNCSDECDVDGIRRCWSYDICQEVNTERCEESCPYRCFGPEVGQCCHATCAVGCTGPTERDCLACKDYHYNDHCTSHCPDKSYPRNQECIPF
ncbi:epidermal growth factor receptor-like [Haliotis cracherodii]|uniref:epidermal growth factor receptor-like n=1 Tax=Haliotis rufescens TaxID=6454 RepID=UPI001EB030F4|nr:epidermal growth factor receptor-like [Haliotis rufescens]